MCVSSGFVRTAVLLVCVVLQALGGTFDLNRETCYSRQHRDVAVNTRVALVQKGTVMEARTKPSEKDCILTCCSEDVRPGLRCNLVVYNPPQRPGDQNCQLFYCPNEKDCPLKTAKKGINTYNIFKGSTHPTTKANGRITAKPAASEQTQLTTTLTPPTNTTTNSTRTTTPTPTPTTAPPPTKSTATTTTTTPKTTTTPPPTTSTEEPLTESQSPVMLVTIATTTAPAATTTAPAATTTTTTTQSTTTTTTTTRSTSTKAPRPPVKPNRGRKPNKPPRPETHSVKPVRTTVTHTPATTTTSTTTTTTITTATTTTTTPTTTVTTTTSPTPPPAERPTAAVLETESESKRRGLGLVPLKPKVSRMMWKNSLVAIVVITLIFLVLILALVARKAMESFDRRHYTRLELNDLHYEV